jgi:vacuolar protein sorting-associated protein 53
MDPPPSLTFGSPGLSRVVLPLIMTTSAGADGTVGGLGTPPLSGPSTGSSVDGAILKGSEPAQKREVFSDIRRFVSFGLRRDTQSPS